MDQNYRPKSESRPPDGVTQNFFIILPNEGVVPAAAGSAQSEKILHAIRIALGAETVPEVHQPAQRATFEDVAREWFQNNAMNWAPSYAGRLKNRLELGLLEHLGTDAISSISPQDMLAVIRRTEARGVRETARRILRIASAVFRYGIATGQCPLDPTVSLRGALRPPKAVRHRAMLSAKDLPKFLKALERYQGDLTRFAIELVLLTFVRTAELRFAKWSEFEDLEGSKPLWRIPAERMKMRRTHLVPLPKQAVEVLGKIRELTCGSAYLFPASTKLGVISENTLLFALYRMGYRRRATVPGFRSLASTVLNESQFNRDWIEMQLAHVDSSVHGVYNAAEWLSGRRQMLRWWADYVDERRR